VYFFKILYIFSDELIRV